MAQALSCRSVTVEARVVYVGSVVDKVALGQVFLRVLLFFSLSISFHRCSITMEKQKNPHHLSCRVAQ
jgi:hypothetical protein